MMEKGCKWFFGPEGGRDNGPTNPSKGTFRSLPDINIVREAIQNSLDVPAGDDPVEVAFSFNKMTSAEFPNFFGVREHIVESLKFFKKTERAQEKFPPMIRFLSSDKNADVESPGAYVDSIDVLTISDRKTKGMPYVVDDRSCPFYAFFHSIGVSVGKDGGAGGSNGLGKETLYNRSEIKTLLLSTRTLEGQVVFQGTAALTTHCDPETREKVTAFGYYGKDKDSPVTVEDEIPEQFRRSDVGTDIHIVGVDLSNRDEVRNSIVEAVLNHFWLAVYRKKLVVDVDGVRIDGETLGELINRYFKDNVETKVEKYDKWNPRPYYNAVIRSVSKKEKTADEEANLPTLGHVRMYLDWGFDDLPKRISYMRQPRMVIYKKTRRSFPSFVAVFVCDNDTGNRVLRCVEPPAHDGWGIENYEGFDKAKYRQGLVEVEKFVNETLDKYLKPKSCYNEIVIPGIAELLPDTDEETTGGEKGTVGSGSSEGLQPSGKLAKDETAAPTSYIPEGGKPVEPVRDRKGTGSSIVVDAAPADDGEPAEIVGSETNDSDGGDSPGDCQGDTTSTQQKGVHEKKGAKTQVRVPIRFTPVTFKRDGVLWHRLIVRPDPTGKRSDYANVTLYVKTGSDNGAVDDTEIKTVSGLLATAKFSGNRLSGVDVRDSAKFDVLFADNIMHSVKVVAYASK